MMIKEYMDIHNHTIWSDGRNSPEEIIENAIKNGITLIGISDHYNTTKCKSISEKKLPQYIEKLKLLKEKYRTSIEVSIGIEICTVSEWCDLDALPIDKINELDYVLFEYVDLFEDSVTLKDIDKYVNKLNCKVGLAHTDLLQISKKHGINFVIDILKKNNLFWELNVNPGYEYFDNMLKKINTVEVKDLFNKLQESNIVITVGSDTHSLSYYDIEKIKKGNELAKYNLSKIY